MLEKKYNITVYKMFNNFNCIQFRTFVNCLLVGYKKECFMPYIIILSECLKGRLGTISPIRCAIHRRCTPIKKLQYQINFIHKINFIHRLKVLSVLKHMWSINKNNVFVYWKFFVAYILLNPFHWTQTNAGYHFFLLTNLPYEYWKVNPKIWMLFLHLMHILSC